MSIGDEEVPECKRTFRGVVYPTYNDMVGAKREHNQRVLKESGLLEAKAVIDAEHAAEEGMCFNIMFYAFIWTFI